MKSREDLVMSNTDLSAADPFSAAPFKPPAGLFAAVSLLETFCIVVILNSGL